MDTESKPSLRERNLLAVRKYTAAHHEEVLRRLALKRIREGRTPRPSTLKKYDISVVI